MPLPWHIVSNLLASHCMFIQKCMLKNTTYRCQATCLCLGWVMHWCSNKGKLIILTLLISWRMQSTGILYNSPHMTRLIFRSLNKIFQHKTCTFWQPLSCMALTQVHNVDKTYLIIKVFKVLHLLTLISKHTQGTRDKEACSHTSMHMHYGVNWSRRPK